jgi:alkylhydroperoxidase family enzyme
MARMEPVSVETALALGREIGLSDRLATGGFRLLAHNPAVAKAVYGQLTTLLYQNTLSTRLRELAILRIGWVTGSEYEWAQHWRLATIDAGLPAEDMIEVRDWRNSTRLTPADRAILAAVDDTLADGKISDAVWAECAAHVGGPAELVEMVIAIGNWTMFSQLLRSFEAPLAEGATSWPPDGLRPPARPPRPTA